MNNEPNQSLFLEINQFKIFRQIYREREGVREGERKGEKVRERTQMTKTRIEKRQQYLH